MNNRPHVLVAVLNWGLGHASRCHVLIEALLARGCQVSLASDGAALQLLRAEWPALRAFSLPSWGVRYPTRSMVANMALLLPTLWRALRAEHRALLQLHSRQHFDCLISDNRYGCYLPDRPSVLLTHQLFPRSPWRWSEPLLHRLLHYLIGRFDECWVPDWPDPPGLSGALSHGAIALPVRYVGPLSRMSPCRAPTPVRHLAAVVSGPEPQRTRFEERLLEQWISLPLEGVLVQGLPGKIRREKVRPGLERVSFLPKGPLNQIICESEVVVCRPGYSSLMDLATTGARALLVPTPGQTEQIYLAEQMARRGHVVVQSQRKLDLYAGWQRARRLPGFSAAPVRRSLLEDAIEALLSRQARITRGP